MSCAFVPVVFTHFQTGFVRSASVTSKVIPISARVTIDFALKVGRVDGDQLRTTLRYARSASSAFLLKSLRTSFLYDRRWMSAGLGPRTSRMLALLATLGLLRRLLCSEGCVPFLLVFHIQRLNHRRDLLGHYQNSPLKDCPFSIRLQIFPQVS